MQKYQFKNSLTWKDYFISSLVLLFNPASQAILIVFSFLLSWILYSGIVDDFYLFFELILTLISIAAGMYLLMLALLSILISSLQKKNNEAILKSVGYQKSGIDEEGYTEFYTDTDSEVKWSEFSRIREFRAYFYLYAMKKKFVILPKRLLPDGCTDLLRSIAQQLLAKPNTRSTDGGRQEETEAPTAGDAVVIDQKPRDSTAFQLYHNFVFRKSTSICSIFVLLLFIISFCQAAVTGDFEAPLVMIFILILMNSFVVLLAVLSGRKKEPLKVVYKFRENGFEMSHKFGKVFVEWNKLYTARQTGKYYFLYLSKIHAAIVPKRDLSENCMKMIDHFIQIYNLKQKKQRA